MKKKKQTQSGTHSQPTATALETDGKKLQTQKRLRVSRFDRAPARRKRRKCVWANAQKVLIRDVCVCIYKTVAVSQIKEFFFRRTVTDKMYVYLYRLRINVRKQ